MSSQAEDQSMFNLEQYLSGLSLQPIIRSENAPPFPPKNERSTVTPLTLKPGGYRRLREMHRFDIRKNVIKYFQKLSNVDETAFQELKLPVTRQYNGDLESSPYLIHNALSVVSLLYRFTLKDIQKILETLDQTMRDWSFQTVPRPRSNAEESQSLDPILFCRPVGGALNKPSSIQLIILPLGPWEFASQDFVEFSELKRFDDTVSDDWRSRKWVNADRMWAYLYDLCLDCECHYFVVTSYDQWLFGQFSKHYTNAWFSPTLSFEAKPVSILEMLIYWIHSSFSRPNTLPTPPVYMERTLTHEHFQRERKSHTKRFLNNEGGTPSDSPDEGLPPVKRQRKTRSFDATPAKAIRQARAKAKERYRRPPPCWKQLRALSKMKCENKQKTHLSESIISITPSIAPSSAAPLPESMVPRTKNAWCERWRDMVAMGDEGPELDEPGAWIDVTLQVYNPDTGSDTGDVLGGPDVICPSCCPSSPTLSACSLSSSEIAEWNKPPVEEIDNLTYVNLYQWF